MMDMTGQIIGNYRIEQSLGIGGMGQVYRATHVHLNRPAAIKILHSQYNADPSFQARFLQEARAASELIHPNIIDVLDFGEQDGRFYLIMELVSDGSLRSLQEKLGPGDLLPLYPSIDLVRQAAEGLAYAHKRGMVHRDIKPDNLLLGRVIGEDGKSTEYQVKLTDFGLVQLAEGGVLTAQGQTMGTPAYMSPEQCRGVEIDGRSDIYSLGVVLFEIATGSPPFDTKTLSEAIFKHVYTQPPSPREIRPDVPESLSAIIMRCLEKDPADRFPTADALAAALTALLPQAATPSMPVTSNPTVTPAPPAPVGAYETQLGNTSGVRVLLDREQVIITPGQPISVGATLINMGDITVRAMLTVDGVSPDWVRLPPGAVEIPPQSQTTGPIHFLAPRDITSIAGSYVAIIRVQVAGQAVPSSESRIRVVILPFNATRLALDPPAVTGRGKGVYQVTVENLGNERRKVVPLAGDTQGSLRFTFEPDQMVLDPGEHATARMTAYGDTSMFGGKRETFQFNVLAATSGNGGDDRTPPISGTFVLQPRFPMWLLVLALVLVPLMAAGGGYAALNAFDRDDDNGVAQATATTEPERSETEVAGIVDATSTEEGEVVEEPTSSNTEPTEDAEVPVVEQTEDPGEEATAIEEVPVTEPSSIIAFAAGRSNDPGGTLDIYIMNPDGSNQRALITFPRDDWSPSWSPDGTMIAWVNKEFGPEDIWVSGVGGGEPRRLTDGLENDQFPQWSPDNQWILFTRRVSDDRSDLWRVRADGTGLMPLTSGNHHDQNPEWSPDGSAVAFVSNRNGEFQIFLMNEDGSNQYQLTTGGGNSFNPSWSPNDTLVMFTNDRNGSSDIYVVDVTTGEDRLLVGGPERDYSPAWSPDGSQIAYATREGDEAYLMVVDADGSNPRRVASNVYPDDPGVVWSPDGSQIAFLRLGDQFVDIYVVTLEDGNIQRLTNHPGFDGNVTWQMVWIHNP